MILFWEGPWELLWVVQRPLEYTAPRPTSALLLLELLQVFVQRLLDRVPGNEAHKVLHVGLALLHQPVGRGPAHHVLGQLPSVI